MAGPHMQALTGFISSNTFRQLKFIVPGIVATYMFDTHRVLLGLWRDPLSSRLAR